mgnify:CR=1 FL=1
MQDIKEEIIAAGLPEHIAIIMDGNGRWAEQRGLDRVYGHKQGVDTVKSVVEASGEIGLKYLTLYTFSIENWNRPRAEVDALMGLMTDAIIRETSELMRQKVRADSQDGCKYRSDLGAGFKLWSPLGNCRSCPEVDGRL